MFEVRKNRGISLDVRNGGITFEAVAQNVQTSADVHSGWAGIGVQCINNSKDGFHRTACNTSFEVSGSNVQNRGPGGFGPSSGSCWDYPHGQQKARFEW